VILAHRDPKHSGEPFRRWHAGPLYVDLWRGWFFDHLVIWMDNQNTWIMSDRRLHRSHGIPTWEKTVQSIALSRRRPLLGANRTYVGCDF
jgi:hypothetical protein